MSEPREILFRLLQLRQLLLLLVNLTLFRAYQ